MLRYFGFISQYPFLKWVGDVVYYILACGGAALVLYKLYEKLITIGNDRKKVAGFVLGYAVVAFPAGVLGSRAAGMFYHPMEKWNIDVFLENMLHGASHTFHASIIPPILILAVFTVFSAYRFFTVLDTVFLYLPLGHMLGRVGCLIVGCCWGRSVTLNLFGFHARFMNPIPLYAILINLAIFYFLKRIYDQIYSDRAAENRYAGNGYARNRYKGAIMAAYLVLYGGIRIILEVFRREKKIFFALSQAQVVMMVFILIGLALFIAIGLRRRRSGAWTGLAPDIDRFMTRAFSLLGGVVSYLLLIFLFYHLTYRLRILPWPFRKAVSVADAYGRIVGYLPMAVLPVVAVFWLKKIKVPILQNLRWGRFSRLFYAGLAVSLYYAIDLLVLRDPRLRGAAYWPPVIVLSAMNAVFEEIMYRLAMYKLLLGADYGKYIAIVLQGLLYSVVHFMISPSFGLLSFLYGVLLGAIMQRSDSLWPCILCHFVIDIGCIGKPLLSY